MADKVAAIAALTDAFGEKHLNEEYRMLIQRVLGSLARKRPSPLQKGKENVWAAAAAHAVGRVNFIDDPSQVPHRKRKALYEFFGVAEGAEAAQVPVDQRSSENGTDVARNPIR